MAPDDTDNGHGEGSSESQPPRRPRRGGTPSSTEVAETLAAETEEQHSERPRSEEAPPKRELTEEEAKRGERLVATWFFVAFVAGIAFLVLYVFFPAHDPASAGASNKALGTSLTVALFALAIGITLWVKRLMPNKEIVDERHSLASSDEERTKFGQYFMDTVESTQITKRPLLRRTLLLAAVPLGLAPLWLLRDMGPLPKRDLFEQPWRKGMRMAVAGSEESEKPRLLKFDDVTDYGIALSTVPVGKDGKPITEFNETAKAALLIIRLRPEEIENNERGQVQKKHSVNGVCAFSKICTHAGCPISLYEQRTHHLFCPCHQSTFDMVDGANVVFGPAVRPLPQLPVSVDSEGYLVADADEFVNGPIGPSFWERGSNEDNK